VPAKTLAWTATALLCLWALHANVSPDFTPVRAELGNARGFSRGLLNLVVLPADAPFNLAPAWGLIVCAAAFVLLSSRRPRRLPHETAPRVRRAFLIAGGAAALVLAAAVASPYLTGFRIVLAPRTFVLCLMLIVGARAIDVVRPRLSRWPPIVAGAIAAAFVISAMLQTLSAYNGNYSGFLHIARDVAAAPFIQERPEIARSLIVYDAGYDGQFMYLIAFDPFLRRFADRPQAYRAFIDNPPYRYGRIGFSLITRLAAFGEPARFPATMMWLIVSAHLALATLLALLASRHGLPPLAGLAYLLIPAFMSSLMSALPEALAAAALVGGYVNWELRRSWQAMLWFGAALLIRETGVVLILALLLAGGTQDWKRSLLVAVGSLLPVAVWRIFVATRLYADFGWAAIATNPGDLGVPLAGLWRLWQAGLSRTQPAPEIIGAIAFPALLLAALALAAALVIRRGNIETRTLALAATLYAAVAVSLNYDKIWSHLPSGERGTFELFLCLLLLMLRNDQEPVWARRGLRMFFVALGLYTFLAAPDAGTSRQALLLIR
jgi:hypothetical protein